MTGAACAALISAVIGAAGTAALFKGSFALEPLPGATWGGPILDAYNLDVIAKNKRRMIWQRSGLALLLTSFLMQGVGALVIG